MKIKSAIFFLLAAFALPELAFAQMEKTFTYDVHGRLVRTSDTDNSDMYYAFDDAHNLTYAGVDTPPPGANNHPSCSNFTVTIASFQTSTHTDPIPHCFDPDGDQLTLTQVTDPDGPATASIDVNNTIFFNNISSELTVTTYTVSDGNGGTGSALSVVDRPANCSDPMTCQ